MQPNGAARTDLTITDNSVIVNAGPKGIIGVLGITEMGEPNKPKIIGSWLEFKREFGGYMSSSNFPLLCKRALDKGARLKVSRVAHFTDIEDATTIAGTKATIAMGTGADIATFTAKSVGPWGNKLTIKIAPPANGQAGADITVTLAGTDYSWTYRNFPVVATDTNIADFNLKSKYVTLSLASSKRLPFIYNTAPTVTISAPGAGTTATATAILTNGFVTGFTITAPGSGYSANPTVTLSGGGGVGAAAVAIQTAGAVTAINVTTPSTANLASGAEDTSLIVVTDYVGSSISATGLHAFDGSPDIVKLAALEIANPIFDSALSNYVANRGDIMGVIHTPAGVDAATQIEYRTGTGAYGHAAIDNWRMIMTSGGLQVTHPTTGLPVEITESGDAVGVMSRKDNRNPEWFTFAGPQRGVLSDAIGVLYNVGTAARTAQADALDNHGINPVIVHDSFGVVFWGNSTLHRADTLLKHANVAELLIAISRAVKPLTQSQLFQPNDMDTWRAIHRRVIPYMELVKNGRGIFDYVYQGDQDVDTLDQVQVNTVDNIQAGMYKFILHIAPIVGQKYQQIEVSVSNSAINFSIAENQ